ncbi:MAG: T9SS type A sorting domain-containing protein [Ignavibacteria bacterium]
MKTKILFIVMVLLLISCRSFSQTGNATISQTNNGTNIEVSIFLRSTSATQWSLGFASFVFNYNKTSMVAPAEFSEGTWDNDSNSEYADQIIASYGNGSAESIEIGLNSLPAAGTMVPLDSTLVGTIRFDILDPAVLHNLSWNLVFTAVLDNNGNDITGNIIFTDPGNGVLPVELASFISDVYQNDVTLKWTTAGEHNNSGFTIERNDVSRNINGAAGWNEIGFLNGNGNSNETRTYSFNDRNLHSGKFNYRLKQNDFNGNYEFFNLSNEVNIGIPEKFYLSQNFPNPFNPETKISYDLPSDSKVSLKVFDISGKEVAVMLNDFRTAGYYTIVFNTGNLSSGIYFYTLSASDNTMTKKMMVIK